MRQTGNKIIPVLPKIVLLTALLAVILVFCGFLGIAIGSSNISFTELIDILMKPGSQDSPAAVIVWQIRLPRVILAAVVGATLGLGGLVFQALLRNPLAEPYILGISGGSAIGAIIAMLAGMSMFPWVSLAAFVGSLAVLIIIMLLASATMGSVAIGKETLLLGGVMMNAFCGAVIMFLISISQSSQVHHILFWLMGDLSVFSTKQLPILLLTIPCFIIIYSLARPMNLLLTGSESAAAMGVNVRTVTVVLLLTTSFMVSIVVCQSGLVGFVGLVIPHIFRIVLGADHRLLVPSAILGGASYLVVCDMLARTLPANGEMPVGIITALIGAPLFVFLLWRAKR